MAVDVLAVCAHPDDAELGCAGLLLRCKAAGARVGVVDLTRGELGSRGNAALRHEERARATAILGLDVRLDLDLPDGFVERTVEYRTRLVEVIRSEQPRMLVGPYWEDHHPDHVNTSLLMKDAWWFAGVAKHPGGSSAHRPEAMLFQLSRYVARPSLIVDISEQFATKARAVACYASQLHRPPAADGPPDADGEPETYLSRSDFLAAWEGRHRYYGRMIGAEFGEAYLMRNPVPITDPMTLLAGRPGVM
jgi:bacillithiol biosynthesis deacetylase BshB1